MEANPPKLIHVGRIAGNNPKPIYLTLFKHANEEYVWHQEGSATDVKGLNVEEAIQNAQKKWKNDSFRTLNCGFRYTLPERDEHGSNALLHQMIASYSSPNGVYFDEQLGHNCVVQFASQEALSFWKQIK